MGEGRGKGEIIYCRTKEREVEIIYRKGQREGGDVIEQKKGNGR